MIRKPLILSLGLMLAASAVPANHLPKGGTSIMHFMVKSRVAPLAAGGSVSGRLEVKQNTQGHADVQRVRLIMSNLAPSTEYLLLVNRGAEPNTYEQAASFTSDAKGEVRIMLMSKGNGRGSPRMQQVPENMRPLSDLRAVLIQTADQQDVAWVSFLHANLLQYLVKRSMTPSESYRDVRGKLRMKATLKDDGDPGTEGATENAQFLLEAFNLEPNASYTLSLNNQAVTQEVVADAFGKVTVNALPDGIGMLDLRDVSLLDGSETVLSTVLFD